MESPSETWEHGNDVSLIQDTREKAQRHVQQILPWQRNLQAHAWILYPEQSCLHPWVLSAQIPPLRWIRLPNACFSWNEQKLTVSWNRAGSLPAFLAGIDQGGSNFLNTNKAVSFLGVQHSLCLLLGVHHSVNRHCYEWLNSKRGVDPSPLRECGRSEKELLCNTAVSSLLHYLCQAFAIMYENLHWWKFGDVALCNTVKPLLVSLSLSSFGHDAWRNFVHYEWGRKRGNLIWAKARESYYFINTTTFCVK